MNRLKNLIERCHERHQNPLQQRQTSIAPAIYNKGIPYEYTVYCAHGHAVKLHALEEANISFMPIGRAPENDRGPRTSDNRKWFQRFSKRQVTGSWEPRRWRESWGIQIYTGIPSEHFGAQWHDINIQYEAICAAPDAVITCIDALVDTVVNPLLTISKSGGIRFSCRIPDYLHPKVEEERSYINKHTPNKRTVYLEILGEEGYSRWDARYEILRGNLLDPPVISRDTLFAPIDILRDVLHESDPAEDKGKEIVTAAPLSLGTHRLDLAREAFVRRGFSYVRQNNGFHHWTQHRNEDRNKHVSLWERDGTVWIRASAPGTGLPIETTPITDVWNDTGILPSIPYTGLLLSDDFLAVQQGKISPLTIKRSVPILGKQKHSINEHETLKKDANQLQNIFKGGARILGLITETDIGDSSDITSYVPENIALCVNAPTHKLAVEIEQLFQKHNFSSYAGWKPRIYLWEQVKDIPFDERIANPFKLGNVCVDPERCNTLEKKGGDPSKCICSKCPVYTECQQHGYLAQPAKLQRVNTLILSFRELFFNPQHTEASTEFLQQIDNIGRLYIAGELKVHDLFLMCELSVVMLEEWIKIWRGKPLGNFANFLLNALELKGRFDGDSVRRIRSVVNAFRLQEKEIVRQMSTVNIGCRVVERGFVDSETGEELSRFTIVFEEGVEAYVPLDSNATDILKAKRLPYFRLRSFVANEDMHIPMQMEEAIQLGILNTETVEDIQKFPTVCPNPNWTVWHQLIRFFEHYRRDEDARVQWDKEVLEFWMPPMLHPNVKRLLVTTRTLTEQHLRRVFPDEEIEVRKVESTAWTQGNKVFQIRTGIYPRETILAYNGNWDVLGVNEIGQRFFAGILAEITRDPSVSHAVITHVAAINQLSEIVDRENVYFLQHFKDPNGWNPILEKAQIIWIVGSPEPPQGRIWRQAQILFGNDEKPLLYEKDMETGLYKDERLQCIYEQNITMLLNSTINCAPFKSLTDRRLVLLTSLALPCITDRSETLLFDWEDFEVAGGLDRLPEVIATRQHFETERANLTGRSDREKVEHILGCSSRQANRFLQKLRGGAPLRVPFRTQILSLLADGDKKTAELVNAIEGNPEAVKNELKRLIDRGEIFRVQRGVYATPSTNSMANSQQPE